MTRAATFGALALFVATLALAPTYGQEPAAPASPGAAAPPSTQQALVQRYCVSCHNDQLATGGLSLQGLDPDRPLCAEDYNVWAAYANADYPEGFCHACGRPAASG
jgi:hypothetical protein